MRFLPGSDIAYDLQKHRWIALGYIYEPRPPATGVPDAVRKRPRPALQEEMRAALHAEYLLLAATARSPPSIVGTYLVDCAAAGACWPNQPILSIRTTSLPGVFQASYRLGDVEGPMMMSSDADVLAYFCGKDVYTCEDSGAADDEEHDSESGQGSPARPRKAAPTDPLTFHVVTRSFCEKTGQVMHVPQKGTVVFTDKRLSAFKGATVLRDGGELVDFSGRKICGRPGTHFPWENCNFALARQCE